MTTPFAPKALASQLASLAPDQWANETALRVMAELMQHRRSAGAPKCSAYCPACLAPHLSKVVTAVEQNIPVTFVLPAFPGKSPNTAKVLGHLPDLAERESLEFLQQLCERIQQIYAPGAAMILCSDGRVFSDIVGMREEDVSAYQREISAMIRELGLTKLSTFNLDEIYEDVNFDQMRTHLMENFGASLESLQMKVRRGGLEGCAREDADAHRMYLGITRFLVEDASHPGQTQSRTAIQKDCKVRAYEVIRRSNAWSELVAERFPDAVRLSIHPQTCGSAKLGIMLLKAGSWMTPWHGVAVKFGENTVLLKRAKAEALGARMVQSSGRPSHFELPERRRVLRVI